MGLQLVTAAALSILASICEQTEFNFLLMVFPNAKCRDSVDLKMLSSLNPSHTHSIPADITGRGAVLRPQLSFMATRDGQRFAIERHFNFVKLTTRATVL